METETKQKIQDEINYLITQEVPHDAIAIYGTSLGMIKAIFETGFIPGFTKESENLIESQSRLVNDPQFPFLYYFHGLFYRFKELLPDIHNLVSKRLSPDDLEISFRKDALDNFSDSYARTQSIKEVFFQIIGYRVIGFADVVLENLLYFFRMDNFLFISEPESEDQEDIDKLKKCDFQKLKHALIEANKRKGYIIYFNKSLLEGSILAGSTTGQDFFENAEELVLQRRDKLSRSCICGIKPLSQHDRKLLVKLFIN